MNVTSPSYTKANGILNKVRGFINDAANFESYSMRDELGNLVSLDASMIQTRAVQLAIQPGKATLNQWEQIAEAIKYGKQNGVQVQISFIK